MWIKLAILRAAFYCHSEPKKSVFCQLMEIQFLFYQWQNKNILTIATEKIKMNGISGVHSNNFSRGSPPSFYYYHAGFLSLKAWYVLENITPHTRNHIIYLFWHEMLCLHFRRLTWFNQSFINKRSWFGKKILTFLSRSFHNRSRHCNESSSSLEMLRNFN